VNLLLSSILQLTSIVSLEQGKTYADAKVDEPLGVGAAVCPFNFPAMIPLWNMVSIATGNALIIKPSE
jgi:acyl-CoA reductase-like NAD-dependent aldehyde dehydrogenase